MKEEGSHIFIMVSILRGTFDYGTDRKELNFSIKYSGA